MFSLLCILPRGNDHYDFIFSRLSSNPFIHFMTAVNLKNHKIKND